MVSSLQLPRCCPEAQGVSSAAILDFIHAVEAQIQSLHSFMLLRHGAVLAAGWWAPHRPEHLHQLYSLSKSFTATAIGLAIAEGLLTLQDRVIDYFPDERPARVSKDLAAMRIHHLLSMNTGHVEDTTFRIARQTSGNWAAAFLSCPVKEAPGTHFLYNTGATYMLSAILQQVAGCTLLEYLEPRLLAPLGIWGATWESCPRGINVGGWGLSLRTEDIARFGQLYLQDGVWEGRPVLPPGWVATASAKHSDNGSSPASDWEQGYGYQFWRCRHNAYRGDGAMGQFCVILPEQDAVLAMTGGLVEMQPVLDLVWEHLLPGFRPAPLAGDAPAQAALHAKLAGLVLPVPPGEVVSPLAAEIERQVYRIASAPAGLISPMEGGRRVRFETGSRVRFEFGAETSQVIVTAKDGEQRLTVGQPTFGRPHWAEGACAINYARQPFPAAAAGAWSAPDVYTAYVSYPGTPYVYTLTFRFDAAGFRFSATANASFGPLEGPEQVGRRI